MPGHYEILDELAAPAAAAVAAPPAQGDVLLTWGAVAFGASTASLDRLRRSTEHRWPAQERIGLRPSRQSVGPGEDAVTVEGVLYPAVHPRARATLDALRAQVLADAPHLLTDGEGRVWGDWVGRRLSETRDRLWPDGAPRRIEWTLELSHLGTDDPAGRADETERRVADAAPFGRAVAAAEAAAAVPAAAPADVVEGIEAAAEAAGDDARALDPRIADTLSAARRVLADGGDAAAVVREVRRQASRLPGAPQAVQAATIAYRARDGDTADDVAWRRYGAASAVSDVLAATPGLGRAGSVLRAGTLVALPDRADPAATAARVIELWE